jgi:hypothetical protein
MKFYPKNTIANFTTKLPDRIALDGEYEVALTEILYPASYKNFIANDLSITFISLDREQLREGVQYEIRSGYYKDENAFCNQLNRKLNRVIKAKYGDNEDRVTFEYDNRTRKLEYTSPTGRIDFNDNDRLGFKSATETISQRFGSDSGIGVNAKANVEFDLIAGTRFMYVYSDISSHNYVGDIKTPLLRVFNTEGVYGRMVTKTFLQPQYLPVSRREFETIEIQLCSELGTVMPFMAGKVVVTLHFRRANKYL